FFFLIDPRPTEISTLPLHAAFRIFNSFQFNFGIFFYYILTKIVNPFDNDEKDIVNSMFKKVKLSFIRL
ncbi:TPA: hypothetical protein DCG82_00250, partial [candidate division WOR-3]|nr:hypothetical protein [candidate division WOR-3 bacterium]